MTQFEKNPAAQAFIENGNVLYLASSRYQVADTPLSAYDDPMTDTPSRQEVDAKIAASAAEMRSSFEVLRTENAEFRADMKAEMAELRTEVSTGFAEVRKEAQEMNANISRWMLQSIIAIIGTIVLGFGTLLWNFSKASLLTPIPQQQPIIITVPAPASVPPAVAPKK